MKNRILTLVMVLCMVGVLVGCSKLTKMNDGYYRCTIETKEEIIEDEVNGETVDLFTKSVDDIVFEEKEELDGLKALLETYKNSYEEFCDGFTDSCKENYDYIEHLDGDENFIPFFTQRNIRLVSNEEDLISIIFDISGYWGGAHGFSYYELLNYNPKTGNKILFEDVIDTSIEG
ncbi:MAG: hypothetical protein MJ246_08500 [Clostridia bacterium]|nr:hypothetical protein [Clostridia bacterium]